jgi:SWI/SNF-related matrix-associated actin-dependent regulator of chromatin subfamily A member 5
VRKIRCNNRLLITGTPLQNNLHELWALLNILFPEALKSSALFDASFRISALYSNGTSADKVADTHLMQSAYQLLRPLMLRRLKREVLAHELPPKVETKVMVPLSKMQRFLYSAILTQDLEKLVSAAGNATDRGEQRAGRRAAKAAAPMEYARLSSLLMQLRKVCCCPAPAVAGST